MKLLELYFLSILLSLTFTACSTNSGIVSPNLNCGTPSNQSKKLGLFFQESDDAGQCMISCPTGYAYDPYFSNETPTGNCFLVGQLSNCSRIKGAETCDQVGCIELSDNTCISPEDLENRCSGLGTSKACNDTVGCNWNSNTSLCSKSIASAFCSQFLNESKCEDECFWNEFTNKCQSVAAACSDFENATDCNKTNICSWRSDNTCGTAYTSCIDRQGEDSCNLSRFCTWDTDRCLSKLSSYCSDAKSQKACQGFPTCTWDSTGVCIQAFSLCASFESEQICKNQGCAWDQFHCISKTIFQTCDAASSESACNQLDKGCYWDAFNRSCISKSTTPCFTLNNKTTCNDLECIWTDKCYSPNMLCSYAGSDQALCTQLAACTFEAGSCISNYSCTLVKDKNSCQSFLSCGYDSKSQQCISKIWCVLPTLLGGVTCD